MFDLPVSASAGQNGSRGSSDFVTVLTGTNARIVAAKKIPRDGKPQPAGHDKWFFVDQQLVFGLADFHSLLQQVAQQPRSLLIRGRLRAGPSYAESHRRNGDTFEDVAHHWVMLDMDDVQAPRGADPTDLHTVDWLVTTRLPVEFHDSDYIAHFSGSAGTKHAGQKVKVHLIFWLAQPANSRDLRWCAKELGADPALFNPVQPHFIAPPIFEGGADPLAGMRLFYVKKGQPTVDFVPRPVVASTKPMHRTRGDAASDTVRDPETGLITDGREGWLRSKNYAALKNSVLNGCTPDASALTKEVWDLFRLECSVQDGTWSEAAVAEKIRCTIDRYERGQIPGLDRLPKTGLSPYYPATLPQGVDVIRNELREKIEAFFHANLSDMISVTVLAAPPGSGKTFSLEASLRKFVDKTCDVFVPSLALGQQIVDNLGPEHARLIRGRTQDDPDRPGNTMCDRAAAAEALGRAGLSVTEHLCRGCPLHNQCRYQRQFLDPPRVLVMAHSYLHLPQANTRRPDFVVIDEAFYDAALFKADFPLSGLRCIADLKLRRGIKSGLEDGRLLAALARNGITPDLLLNAGKSIYRDQSANHITGRLSDSEVVACASRQKPVSPVAGWLRWLARELAAMKPVDDVSGPDGRSASEMWLSLIRYADDRCKKDSSTESWQNQEALRSAFRVAPLARDISHTAVLRGDRVFVSYPKALRRLEGQPVLCLDGSADRNIASAIFGSPVTFYRWEAERYATVYQITDTPNGKTALLADRQRIDQVIRFARRLSGRGFVVAQKGVRCHLTGEDPTSKTLSPGEPISGSELRVFHYGQARGLNSFADDDFAVLLGRMQPPLCAVECYAGFFWADPEPIQFSGRYEYQDRGFSGHSGQGVAVQVHPDPRLDAFLRQVREEGIVQAADRLRLCDATDQPRFVFLFCNIPTRIRPDVLVTQADLCPEWLEVIDMAGGVLLKSATWLARQLPKRFPTVKSAEDWLRRGGGASIPWGVEYKIPAPAPKESYSAPRGFCIEAWTHAAGEVRAHGGRANWEPKTRRIMFTAPILEMISRIEAAMQKPVDVTLCVGPGVYLTNILTPADAAAAHQAADSLVAWEAREAIRRHTADDPPTTCGASPNAPEIPQC